MKLDNECSFSEIPRLIGWSRYLVMKKIAEDTRFPKPVRKTMSGYQYFDKKQILEYKKLTERENA